MSPLHLCSTESLDDLNMPLEKKIKVYNFRPNIIMTNVAKPYAEVDYHRKPMPYGEKPIFDIDLAPTSDKINVTGIIRVGDSIQN